MIRIPGPARLALIVALAGVFVFFYLQSERGIRPYGWGLVALVSLWLVVWLLVDTLNPFKLVIGEDGRPSTSKLKPFLWTAVVVFSYAVLYAARVKKGYVEAISEVPPSLLMAIGFDAATLVAARSITESQIQRGQIEKPPSAEPPKKTASETTVTQPNNGPGAVFQDDKGFPELAKIQTVTWTVFAIVIYLVAVNETLVKITNHPYFDPSRPTLPSYLGLPDIAPALMVLIGLGNAAYLGKKLVTTDTPVLTAISFPRKSPGAEVTLTGVALGATQNGSRIIINDKEIDDVPLEWSNERVKFTFPDKNPEGVDWVSGQAVRIRLFVRGQTTNQFTFTIEPFLSQVSPTSGSQTSLAKLTGTALGATKAELNVDNSKLDPSLITSWNNQEIEFKVPDKHPNGKDWVKPQDVSLSVTVQSKQSNKVKFTVN
jgi:hypothetical protein